MLDRRKALGYREITQTRRTLLGPAGQVMRGHEFHYSALIDADLDRRAGAYRMSDRAGMQKAAEGFVADRTLGSYVHLHFGSCPRAAAHFVDACAQWSGTRSPSDRHVGTRTENEGKEAIHAAPRDRTAKLPDHR
jgi:cobyrinic acid a,c-diamide synthase